jgi:hypothetical protein
MYVPVRYKIFSGLAQVNNCLPKPILRYLYGTKSGLAQVDTCLPKPILRYLYGTKSGLAQVDTCLPKPIPVLRIRIRYIFKPWILEG